MSSSRRTAALLVAVILVGSCVESALPSENGIKTPAGETASPVGPIATISISPTPTTSGKSTTPPDLTATLVNPGLPVCSATDAIPLGNLELAFVANWDGDREVYSIHANGSDLRQLTSNTSGDVGPAWSADGQRISLVAAAFTDPRLYVALSDGSGGLIVAPDLEVTSLQVEWSPSGDQVAFRSSDDLVSVDLETGEPTILTAGADIRPGPPRFSPDGKIVAFDARVASGTPRDRLFIVNADGTSLVELSFPQGEVDRPTWHPIRNEIMFEGTVSREGIGIFVATLNGSIARLPIEPNSLAPKPAWSPDGNMIGYIMRVSGFDSRGERISLDSLHIATPDGDVDIAVVGPPDEPDMGLSIFDFVWAPDSRHVAFLIPTEVKGSEGVDLFAVDICDGTSSVVAEAIDSLSIPAWRPIP